MRPWSGIIVHVDGNLDTQRLDDADVELTGRKVYVGRFGSLINTIQADLEVVLS